MSERQYVNLPVDANDPTRGREVRIETTISPAERRVVFLVLKDDPNNHKASDLVGVDRAGVLQPGAKRQAVMTGADGKVTFDLVLSTYGGDKFSVAVAKNRRGSKTLDHIKTYEVWRRLYYQVSRMKPRYELAENDLVAEFEKHFIELEKTGVFDIPYKQNLETSDLKTFTQYLQGTKRPFEAHVVLIDRQCDSFEVNLTGELRAVDYVFTIPRKYTHWLYSDWLVSATWATETASGDQGLLVTRTVDQMGRPAFRVDASGLKIDPTLTRTLVGVRVKLLKGSYAGDGTFPPNFFVAEGLKGPNRPLRTPAVKAVTAIHEIAHGLGMVPSKGHDKHYQDDDCHAGNHCRTGATPDVASKAQGGPGATPYQGGTCVMYGAAFDKGAFCATCKPFVTGVRCGRDDMRKRQW